MQLDSTFSVVAPIDTVWKTLMDFERVAGCVPGAEILNKLSDDAYQGVMKVKLGPVSMQYRGQLTVVERDEAAHRAVFQGRAQESRGQGTADGTATLQLFEEGGTTRGTVSAEFSLSGKVAAMGKGVITSVTEQMMALFATNLQQMVGESGSSVPTSSPPSGPASDQAAAPQPTGRTEPGPQHVSSGPAAAAPDNSLDAVDFATAMIADQLKSPAKLVGFVIAVASVGFALGRLGSRRHR